VSEGKEEMIGGGRREEGRILCLETYDLDI